MITLLRAYLARRKRRRQIRQLEQCLAVLRPVLATPALSLDDVMARHDIAVSVAKAEWCLNHLRERV
jgi:hypothetical protein